MVKKILLKTSILSELLPKSWPAFYGLIGCGACCQRLFFGVDQQAETSKHQGDYAYETQNYPSRHQLLQPGHFYPAIRRRSGIERSLLVPGPCPTMWPATTNAPTADWVHSKQCDDQLIAAAKLNPQQGINTAWPQANSDQLGLLIKWRATCDPTTADYFLQCQRPPLAGH